MNSFNEVERFGKYNLFSSGWFFDSTGNTFFSHGFPLGVLPLESFSSPSNCRVPPVFQIRQQSFDEGFPQRLNSPGARKTFYSFFAGFVVLDDSLILEFERTSIFSTQDSCSQLETVPPALESPCFGRLLLEAFRNCTSGR